MSCSVVCVVGICVWEKKLQYFTVSSLNSEKIRSALISLERGYTTD